MGKFERSYQLKVSDIKIKDAFWTKIQNLIIEEAIPYQEKVLRDEIEGTEKSHAVANYKIAAGLESGEFYGIVFQDSDVSKWLEGVAYALSVKKDKELERRADEIIGYIEKAQEEDGYLDTYFTLKEPEHKWQNLQECHELYCAGHLMEAAAAYYRETGKTKLLEIAKRLADHIERRFGERKEHGIPGHQEVEVGLMRLYKETGIEKYKNLASYFIEERGKNPDYFVEERKKRGWIYFDMDPENREYLQCHAPVREQTEAVGHSVRAVYMYMAMADLAMEMQDESMYAACRKLWSNIVNKRMYITGGIGSTAEGEAFTLDYDLPNDSGYAETCASIAMVMFARRLLDIEPDGEYADMIERELYNGVLSGMQLDGKAFFYVNPLEVVQGVSGELFGYKHVLPRRPGWYACACCPPNLVRLIMALGTYAWTEKEDIIYSHFYLGQETELKKARICIESKYPWEGDVCYKISPKTKDEFTLAVHLPQYGEDYVISLNGEILDTADRVKKGYLYLRRVWSEKDLLRIQFNMRTKRIYANPLVRADAGCVAFMRGPLVYCFEQADQKEPLQTYRIPERADVKEYFCTDGALEGMILLKIEGEHLKAQDKLYLQERAAKERVWMTAVPYFAWGNREEGDMRVWMVE
ncbi:MAG: glycoside hydrolase family 127 protein [Eubacteriales bacterium]|nr:glycoside hydrolase family 127 protein [Eubacteriales bacterium]